MSTGAIKAAMSGCVGVVGLICLVGSILTKNLLTSIYSLVIVLQSAALVILYIREDK